MSSNNETEGFYDDVEYIYVYMYIRNPFLHQARRLRSPMKTPRRISFNESPLYTLWLLHESLHPLSSSFHLLEYIHSLIRHVGADIDCYERAKGLKTP